MTDWKSEAEKFLAELDDSFVPQAAELLSGLLELAYTEGAAAGVRQAARLIEARGDLDTETLLKEIGL